MAESCFAAAAALQMKYMKFLIYFTMHVANIYSFGFYVYCCLVLINMFVSFSPPRNCTLQHIIVSMKKPHWEKRSFSARRRTSTPHKKIVVFPVSTHKRYISSKFPSFPHSPLHFSSTIRSNYVCSFICSTDVVIHTWVHYVSPSYQ